MSTRKLERETGVDRSAWRKLKEAGAGDINAKTRAEVLARRERLDEERIRKMQVQREILEAELAEKRRELVSAKAVEAACSNAGAIMSAKAYALAESLPGMLVGLNEVEMHSRILGAVDRFILDFREAMARCAAPPRPE
jgi:hypothetical protein